MRLSTREYSLSIGTVRGRQDPARSDDGSTAEVKVAGLVLQGDLQ